MASKAAELRAGRPSLLAPFINRHPPILSFHKLSFFLLLMPINYQAIMVYFLVVTVLQRTAQWAMMGENVYKKVWIINSSQAYSIVV